MAEPEDAVMMILRNIQADISRLATRLERVEARVAELTERFDRFESYFTRLLGMTERNRLDIQRLDRDMKVLGARVDQLEPQPQ